LSATIKDVARLAGCSIKTVSRVINDEPHVTAELRDKVQAAVRAAGYAPNLSARRLVQNKSYMVCILMYPGYDQAAAALLSRIMDIGYDENYDILFQPYYPASRLSRNKLVDLVTARRMDGFVTTPPCDADGFVGDLLTTYKVPQIQIDPTTPSPEIPCLAGNDLQGARAMTEYLLGLGHHRVAFLTGPRNLRSSAVRLEGYQAALQSHGLALDPSLLEASEFTFDGGYTAARLLLARQDPPSALFAGSDSAAYGALFAAQELGLSIPADLSISGYSDLTLSKYFFPGLTTVHQPIEEMLEIATRRLIATLKGNPPEENTLILPARLVIRGSTAPPSNKKAARIGNS